MLASNVNGELACKNKLLLKNSLAFEKFNGTLVASQNDFVKEKLHFECSQKMQGMTSLEVDLNRFVPENLNWSKATLYINRLIGDNT